MDFVFAGCERIAIENPVGIMNTAYRKPDQIIHPYYFADGIDDNDNYHTKRTCLWLKGLNPLQIKNFLPTPKSEWEEAMRGISGGQAEWAKARSKTYPGIAKAMAEQWG